MAENKNDTKYRVAEFNSKVVTGTSNTSINYIQKGNKSKPQNQHNNQGKW